MAAAPPRGRPISPTTRASSLTLQDRSTPRTAKARERGGGLKPIHNPAGVFFEHSTAEGEGLTQAFPKQTGRFVLRARDRLFRHVPCSREPFHVVIRGKQKVTPTMFSQQDGSICVEYTIAVCGTYKVHVRGGKKGTHVMGSPFSLNVKAARHRPVSASRRASGCASRVRVSRAASSSTARTRQDGSSRRAPHDSSSRLRTASTLACRRIAPRVWPTPILLGSSSIREMALSMSATRRKGGNLPAACHRWASHRLLRSMARHSRCRLILGRSRPLNARDDATLTPLTRHTKAPSTLTRMADGSVVFANTSASDTPTIVATQALFYLRLIARDALSNDIELQEDGIRVSDTT